MSKDREKVSIMLGDKIVYSSYVTTLEIDNKSIYEDVIRDDEFVNTRVKKGVGVISLTIGDGKAKIKRAIEALNNE